MNRTTALAFAFLVAAALVTAQDVKQAAILIGGKSNPIRFVTFDKEVYISWADLLRLMPSVFSVSSKGEIVVSLFHSDPSGSGSPKQGERSHSSARQGYRVANRRRFRRVGWGNHL